VSADLMLGFFFPGAEMIVTGGHDERPAVAPVAQPAAVLGGPAGPPS
jgi:hypothetical protein